MADSPKPERSYETHIDRQVVRLAELAGDKAPPTIQETEFVDCDVHGPAVVGIIGESGFDRCVFDAPPDHLFIEAQTDRPYLGVIALVNVSFVRCRFHGIGILGPPELLTMFKSALGTAEAESPPHPEQ